MKLQEYFAFLNESPEELRDRNGNEIVPDWRLSDSSANSKRAREILASSRTRAVESIGEYTIYEYGNSYSMIHNDTKRIIYDMKFEFTYYKFLNQKTVTQVQLWRDRKTADSKNIAEHIFFKHLMPNYKIVVTDSEQSSYGKSFWELRIQEAFDRKYNVYFADVMEPRQLVKIKDIDEFYDKFYQTAWGIGQKFKTRKLIISSIELQQHTIEKRYNK